MDDEFCEAGFNGELAGLGGFVNAAGLVELGDRGGAAFGELGDAVVLFFGFAGGGGGFLEQGLLLGGGEFHENLAGFDALAVLEADLDHALADGGGEFHGLVGAERAEGLDAVGERRGTDLGERDGGRRAGRFFGGDGKGERGEKDGDGKNGAHGFF